MLDVRTIYGPPGTGKTHQLIDFAGQESMKRPVTFLSYTKAAAGEAKARITGIGETPDRKSIAASTLHSLAFQACNLNRASVIDIEKLKSYGAATGIEFRQDRDEDEQNGDMYQRVISFSKCNMIPHMQAYDEMGRPGSMKEFAMFCQTYEQWKSTYGYVDFDDMLIMGSKMEHRPSPVVFLDEAQDCSPLQWAFFNKYIESADRVYIAGDDDQAIFEWNGADPHGMIKFSEEHNAKVRVLDQSHRMPKAIHEFVHDTILAEIQTRVDKEFKYSDRIGSVMEWADMTQVDFRHLINPNKKTLLLVRDSYRMIEIQKALHSDLVPYSVAGARPSPYESGLANAIRGWKREGGPNELERGSMQKFARDPSMPIEQMLKIDWRDAFKVPMYLHEFYDKADLFSPPTIKLSTIHTAKGTEADDVMVDLTITERVAQGIDLNRDAELRVWYVALTRAKDKLHIFGENPLFEVIS